MPVPNSKYFYRRPKREKSKCRVITKSIQTFCSNWGCNLLPGGELISGTVSRLPRLLMVCNTLFSCRMVLVDCSDVVLVSNRSDLFTARIGAQGGVFYLWGGVFYLRHPAPKDIPSQRRGQYYVLVRLATCLRDSHMVKLASCYKADIGTIID